MKNILKHLEQPNTSVYVRLPDAATAKQFLREAEAAGFLFQDGAKPTVRACGSIMVLKNDRTICYAGSCGQIAFGCPGATTPGRRIVRLQFQNGASAPVTDFKHTRKESNIRKSLF